MKSLLTATALLFAASLTTATYAQCCAGKDKAQAQATPTAQAADKQCNKPCDKPCDGKAVAGNCDPAKCDPANCDKSKCAGACTGSDCSGKCPSGVACSGPKMSYKVAGETLNCPKNAEILAKANDTQFTYVVGNTEYDNEQDAMKAFATALEGYLTDITTVSYAVGTDCVKCPKTAAAMAEKAHDKVGYRVATWTFDSQEKAEHAARAAREAADKVELKYVVNDKEYTCPQTAAAAANECHAKCQYKVGDNATGCELTARVRLAQARIAAARQAILADRGQQGDTVASAMN